jgi:hypothetical protein
METTEIILRENGTLTERVIRERDLNAGPAVLAALTESVTRSVRQVLRLPEWGAVHASVGLDDTLWTVVLDRLPLATRFRLVADVLVPAFAAESDLELSLVWQVPRDMRLAFVVRTETEEGEVVIHQNYLFACDTRNRAYRLPLPNLFDDCKVCTGEFARTHPCGAAAVAASVEQFRASPWNADLMPAIERSQQCFRFQPTNESFTTLPIAAADWTTLCDKVSTAVSERIVL